MPHRCTNCENTVPDESEDLFGGCTECGNDSWEYIEGIGNSGNRENKSQKNARTEFVSDEELPDDKSIDVLQDPTAGSEESDEVRTHRKVKELEELRTKLNDQYEGIEVHREGHYEINLTELYRGSGHIIEVGEDGAYHVTKSDQIDT